MDEELVGQLREISGETIVACDLCGKPVDGVTVVVLERHSSGAPETEMRICASCRRQMDSGELPLDPDEIPAASPDNV